MGARTLVLALALFAATVPAASGERPQPPLDAALRQAVSAGGIGAQAAIYRCGELVWAGSANATPNTRFGLASVTKAFTATMVMQLVEDGKLTLDTKLARFYPRLPNASRITVRMLLTHRSGLADYLETDEFDRVARDPRHAWTRDEVLSFVTRARFRPGSRSEYSNTNYVALGGILERVSGLRIERLFQTRVARPIGLARSSFLTRIGPTDTWGEVWTDGGLVSTARDLASFGDALFGGDLLRRPPPGLFTLAGWRGHDGSYPPWEAQLWNRGGVTIAVTTRGGDSEAIWDAVAAAYEEIAPARGC